MEIDIDIELCFKILGIAPNATYNEAKEMYRLLVQVWHPDKYINSPKLHVLATDKMKEINTAWNILEKRFKQHGEQKTTQTTSQSNFNDKQTHENWQERQHYEHEKPQDFQSFFGFNSDGFRTENKWLNFWMWVLLPYYAIISFVDAIYYTNNLIALVPAFLGLFYITVTLGIYCRKKWAWQWKWLVIVLIYFNNVSLLHHNLRIGFMISSIMGAIVWLFPNMVYWTKRRNLFE